MAVKVTGKRKRMLILCLAAGALTRNRLNWWVDARGDLFGATPGQKLATTQNVLWAVREGLMHGRIVQGGVKTVRLTPSGEHAAAEFTAEICACPECESRNLVLARDGDRVEGLGCLICQGMFWPRVVALAHFDRLRHTIEPLDLRR